MCCANYVVFLLLVQIIGRCWSACYFPSELQGEFVMQSSVTADTGVQYSTVNITIEAISIWGHCHRRSGNSVILLDSFGGGNCIRCFHLRLLSRNVLQVETESLDKCYTTLEAAQATCPDHKLNSRRPSKQIILYKSKEVGGLEVRKDYCPINGKFTFIYNINDGSENNTECMIAVSELDNCPTGSELNLRFRKCSFDNHDIKFFCLGHWEGPDQQQYLALVDTRTGGDRKPQYRCAIYKEEDGTGIVYMAFSNDSTCNANLKSATEGYETLLLTSAVPPAWPQIVVTEGCRFPGWAQGHWEQLTVENNTLTYRDHTAFKTFTMKCMGPNMSASQRFVVFGRTQCGEEMFGCIWIKKRTPNVLEFQLGMNSSMEYSTSLCHDVNFVDNVWITQGKMERLEESPCPVMGEYNGMIPDADGLCARLSSDCQKPEIMYYTVSDCQRGDIYDEREYRCLGQWEEGDLTYTYTQRKDVGSYECFVGFIFSDNELYIKEAGEHCERDIEPLKYGMKLTRNRTCSGSSYESSTTSTTSTTTAAATTTTTTTTTPRPFTLLTKQWTTVKRIYPTHPTKPWKAITAPPRHLNEIEDSSGDSRILASKLFVVIVTLHFLFH